MKRLSLLVIAVLLISVRGFSQDFSLYQKKAFNYAEGESLLYRILYPENYDRTKKYPVIVFLHGSGEKGNDNEAQLAHAGVVFLRDSIRKKYPAIVIFPQCPTGSSWHSESVEGVSIGNSQDYNNVAPWPLLATNALVQKVIANEGGDKSRIYISGLSMGGFGTFEMVYRFPKVYAAAAPICGAGDSTHYDKRIKKTAFWVFHGDQDPAVNVNHSRTMVARLKALKANVRYTEYPGVGHNSWDNAFLEPEYISWMFAHKR